MATTVWGPSTINAATTGNAGYSFRNEHKTLAAGSLGQVRVTFQATAGATLNCDHCSIGVATGSPPNTVATPVELTFSAAHGFTLVSIATITSDWVNLSFLSSDHLIVDIDLSAGGSGATCYDATTPGTDWNKAASADYATASVSGYSSNGALTRMVLSIETQAGGSSEFHRGPQHLDGMGTLFTNPIG